MCLSKRWESKMTVVNKYERLFLEFQQVIQEKGDEEEEVEEVEDLEEEGREEPSSAEEVSG
jgi:hypothetical protein